MNRRDIIVDKTLAEGLEKLGFGLAVFAADLTLVYLNAEYLRLMGFGPEIGQPGVSIERIFRINAERGEYGPGDIDQLVAERLDACRRREAHRFERVRPNGVVVQVEGWPLESGGFISTFRDITAQKGIEQTLLNQLSFLQPLLDAIPVPVFYKDVNGKYLGCNSEFEIFIGHKRECIIGFDVGAVSDEPLSKIYRDADNELFLRRGLQVYEGPLRASNGEEREVVFRKATFDRSDGSVGGLIGVILDITERKRAEKALRVLHGNLEVEVALRTQELAEAKVRAEEASSSKSRFLANMSHELRTPLNAVVGFADAMRQAIFGEIGNPHYVEYVDRIHQAGQHLSRLVDDILDLAKVEEGYLDFTYESVSLGCLLEDLREVIRPLAEPRGNAVMFAQAIDADVVWADRFRLHQIVLNLLSNAIKFTENGQVRLDVQSRRQGDRREIRICVSDTGTGIPASRLSSLFDPFEQGDPLVARRFGGSGLGLSISRTLCEAMGGRIYLSSEVGVGTTVVLYLPQDAP